MHSEMVWKGAGGRSFTGFHVRCGGQLILCKESGKRVLEQKRDDESETKKWTWENYPIR